ncbi:MAG: class I SAM-dependent methyltransferase [Betaproteobacteria bacterium]
MHEIDLAREGRAFSVPGFCYLCQKDVKFTVDFQYTTEWEGSVVPIYREKMNCECCGFNNRMRAAVQILEDQVKPRKGGEIYLTEQVTPMYKLFCERYGKVVGSEYLGESVPWGSKDARGVRNESVTRLTFADGRFAAIVSFDVLEHVPDYKSAFKECLRCLEPGGVLLFSVPFNSATTVMRARIAADGRVEHILPPEYHGDPLKDAGCLCFYHFGWDVLDALRAIGFQTAEAFVYYSEELGYIGFGEQMIFAATKSAVA